MDKEQVIVPMNPEAINYLNWLDTDCNSLRNYAFQIFAGNIDISSEKFNEIKNAADIALKEVEDDIAKIKEFLASYIPPNNK